MQSRLELGVLRMSGLDNSAQARHAVPTKFEVGKRLVIDPSPKLPCCPNWPSGLSIQDTSIGLGGSAREGVNSGESIRQAEWLNPTKPLRCRMLGAYKYLCMYPGT